MGSVGCLAKGNIFFWQNILKNRSKYRGDISEQSVVCTVLISAIIIEIFRKNIPISYIIPYKRLASPLIPVCLLKSHMYAFWETNPEYYGSYISVNICYALQEQWGRLRITSSNPRPSTTSAFDGHSCNCRSNSTWIWLEFTLLELPLSMCSLLLTKMPR